MDSKDRIKQLINELTEEEAVRVLNFASEVKEVKEKEIEEVAPVAFWDNDDKVWNEISR